MATGSARPPAGSRWRLLLWAALSVGLVELALLVFLMLQPGSAGPLPGAGQAGLAPLRVDGASLPEAQPTDDVLLQGMRAMDRILERRVELAAAEQGRDPADLLPPAALREAAFAGGGSDAGPWRALLAAYRASFEQLGLPTDLIEDRAIPSGGYQ